MVSLQPLFPLVTSDDLKPLHFSAEFMLLFYDLCILEDNAALICGLQIWYMLACFRILCREDASWWQYLFSASLP